MKHKRTSLFEADSSGSLAPVKHVRFLKPYWVFTPLSSQNPNGYSERRNTPKWLVCKPEDKRSKGQECFRTELQGGMFLREQKANISYQTYAKAINRLKPPADP